MSTNQEEHLGLMLEAAPVAIVAVDEMGRIVHLNAQVEQLFGYTRDELAGMSIERLVPERFRGAHPALRHGYGFSPTARPMGAGRDLFALRKDGTEMPVEIGLSPIETSQGRFVLATVIDITERKRAEELRLVSVSERRRRLDAEADRDRAIDASLLKSQFVATMSHELRTPLNAIIGMTELLAGTPLTDRQMNYVEKINESAEALLGVINGILDFSKIEAGKMQLEVRPFDVETVVGGTADVLAQQARQKGLVLYTYIDPAIPPHLGGDPDRLRQILLNLIGNAVKFTREGRVVVRALVDGIGGRFVNVRFEIDDTGIGIPEDVIPKLFEPFVQADSSASRRFTGTGLGLSISKRLVGLMGGDIGVNSKPGIGSQFWFTARFDIAAGVAPAPRILGVSALVAMRDDFLAEIIERYLESWRIESRRIRDASEVQSTLGNAPDGSIAIIQSTGFGSSEIVAALRAAGLTADRILAIGLDERVREPLRPSKLFDRLVEVVSAARLHPQELPADESLVAAIAPPSVLVAEDNAAMHEVLTSQFEQLGINVRIVTDGALAVSAVQHGDYDLVFMDCQMPNIDGYEATRLIRAEERGSGRHVPIIAMTANAFKEDRDACLAAGMDDHLAKPVRLKNIQSMIEKWHGGTALERPEVTR